MTYCEDPELMIRWADYLYSPEGQVFKNYGVEGESLSYNANGDPQLDYDLVFRNPDWSTQVASTYYLGAKSAWTINDTALSEAAYSDSQLTCIDAWEYHTDTAYTLSDGLTLNTEESAAFSEAYSDISTYIAENVNAFIMGEKEMSEFDAFVETICSMDVDTVINSYQSALDRYNSRG